MGAAGWAAWVCLVLAASLGALGRRPRRPPGPAATGRPARAEAVRMWAARAVRLPRRRTARPENEVGAVLVAVAARLRAGMAPAAAWERSLRAASPGVAAALRAALAGPGRSLPAGITGRGWRAPRSRAARTAVDSAVVARDVAHRLGAELADVLDACAAGIEEAGRAAADRTSALGGPRATARLLSWLPLGGLVLGTALGADPLGWLIGSWWGLAVAAPAAAFALAGHLWIRALIAAAERAGT